MMEVTILELVSNLSFIHSFLSVNYLNWL
jgi:hypothetical protein